MSTAPTRDAFLGGRLVLSQPPKGHRAGTDAALLAAALSPGADDTVFDLGAGVGAAGLALAARVPGCRVVLVELDPAIAALARGNVEANGLSARVAVIEADVTAPARQRTAAGLAPNSAGMVMMNPPFHLPGAVRASPDAYRRQAHVLPAATDEAWIRAAAALLRPGGVLALIHRADALPRLLTALAGRFGDIRLKPVSPRAEAAATRLIVRAVKGSRALPVLLPPLVLHEPPGGFTATAEALHRGTAAIAWFPGA